MLLAKVHPANTKKYHLGLWQTHIFETLGYEAAPVVALYNFLLCLFYIMLQKAIQ